MPPHPMFITALFAIAKTWNNIMPCSATWMELETLTLSEISQKEKDKYMISLITGI